MKRHFDIQESRQTLQLDVDKVGMKYSIAELEEKLKLKGLKEVNKKEYDKLSKEYTS